MSFPSKFGPVASISSSSATLKISTRVPTGNLCSMKLSLPWIVYMIHSLGFNITTPIRYFKALLAVVLRSIRKQLEVRILHTFDSMSSFLFVFLSDAFFQIDTTRYGQGIPITYLNLNDPTHYPYGRDSLDTFLREKLPAEWHSHYIANLYVVVQFIVKQDSTLSDFTFVSGNKKLFQDAIKAVN